ncbi:MAG: glycosyltransferase [Stenomitos rutilans HA7619-LM2]|jgi:glycosyltransferase involved in cell wall biosynthesis|nr:glycosyltransferase [Stenomitos rutilans HA7619-LM2]
MITSFSVIVPVLNKEDEIIRTLDSIDASIAFFHAHYHGDHSVMSELIVVDEASTDRTPTLLEEFGQNRPYFKVIKHFRSLGIGPARNTGAKIAKGDILFFCDGDDLIFQEHIYLCFLLLDHHPAPSEPALKRVEITVGEKTYPLTLPPHPIGVVRTGVKMQDTLHPYWKAAIENTLALNLCIRRDCHEFIEGFPEAPVYKQIGGCEDVSYDLWLAKFFKVLKVEIETVEYIRYPGNNFDRQLKKFQTAPEQVQDDTPSEDKALHLLRRKLEQDHFSYLIEKFRKFPLTADFAAILNWQQLANDYLSQECYLEAIALYEVGMSAEPAMRDSAKNILAAAYNNFGSALHKQGDLEQAGIYFQKAIALKPAFSEADLARVHFNVGTVLSKQQHYEPAIAFFRQATALQPDFFEAIGALTKAIYQYQLLTKGYQFSSSFIEVDLQVLTTYLQPLQALEHLKVLIIGSQDGRLACWLLDNILLHQTAALAYVDHAEASANEQVLLEQFKANIDRAGVPEKVHKITGTPRDVLRSQPYHRYQLIAISGIATASELLEVAVLSWSLLAVGGMFVITSDGVNTASSSVQVQLKSALNAFTNVFSDKLKRLHQGNEILLEKIAD